MYPRPSEVRRIQMRLCVEILKHLDRTANDTDFCGRCKLPLPSGDFESYLFCPWCNQSFNGGVPRSDESRRIVEHKWTVQDDIQCGDCGAEYEQPSRYPFCFCPHCGAPFAPEDEMIFELPFLV